VRTFLKRFSDAINDQECFAALRAGLFRVRQILSQGVELEENAAIRAAHPMKMKEKTDSTLSH
jgi:hypothetical protein